MGNRPDFIAAIGEEIGHPRFWVLLCMALAFFLAATVWDITYLSDPEWVAADAKRVWFAKAKTWIGVLKEMGFASLIALIIAVVIERSSRARQEMTTSERQREIAESVFRGVFETDIPKTIVEEVVEGVLKSKIVRLDHTNTYVLNDRTKEVEGKSHKYIELTATSSYTLQNVSKENVVVPIRLMFPVPGNPHLRDIAKLVNFAINDRALNAQEINAGNEAAGGNTEYLQRYLWERELAPGATVQVRATSTLIKDRSDNEIWTSLYPSKSMRLYVTMNCQDMAFGAAALHRESIKKVAGEEGDMGHHEWELARPVLPYQGIVFWWRPKEIDT